MSIIILSPWWPMSIVHETLIAQATSASSTNATTEANATSTRTTCDVAK